jgi:hypothetical protein
LVAALTIRRDQLLAALGSLPTAALGATTPLPFGLVPTPVALQIVALEYGFHRNDIEWALGDFVPLQADIVATLLEVTSGLLPIFAAGSGVAAGGTVPESSIGYLLRTTDFSLRVVHRKGSWELADDGADAACEIVAEDPSSLALFVMGRIPADHPSLHLLGDPEPAASFKRYFPGP